MDGIQDASSSTVNGNALPPFLSKIYDIVEDPATNPIVSWSKNNNSFIVWNVPEFSRILLPKYFKHSNFSSFVRQLNTYGFRKVDPDRYEFANEGFLRGQKQLMKSISRRKPAHVQSHPQQPQVCVEVGKFGLEEEVERLKRDKNVLMQELVRLRQQQQATDHQLQTVGQRVQVMEQRQQQMMSFLAKAMQSPGFLAQIVQQQNESNRLITGRNKKRRLPKQDEEQLAGENITNSPDGQIVKFQPLMNEAAKAMLRQILKMNASPRLEPSMNNPDAFLIDDAPSSSNILDNESSSVTLLEVPPTSGQSYRPVGSGFHANYPTAAISDNRSSPPVVTDTAKAAQFSEANVHNSRENTILPDFTQIEGIIPESTGKIPDVSYVGSESGNDGYLDRISAVLDGTMSVETDVFSPEPDADILLDGIPKLPGINDAFWEQFFTASPPTGDTDEIDSSTMEGSVTMEQEFLPAQVNGWEKVHYMDNLTEQMGLLASENKTG